jgi:hypothetical protein
MLNDFLKNLKGVEDCRAAKFTKPRTEAIVEARTHRDGYQANFNAEKYNLLRHEASPPIQHDQDFEHPIVA